MTNLLRPEEVAEYFGVPKRTIYKLIKENKLPAFRIGKLIRIRQEDLDRFILDQLGDSR